MPVILAEDFNSDASPTNFYLSDKTASHSLITAAGFSDAWAELRPGNPGYTWSLFPVADIPVAPFERIDLIFSNGPKPISAVKTGMEA